jgi:hypothetical protein
MLGLARSYGQDRPAAVLRSRCSYIGRAFRLTLGMLAPLSVFHSLLLSGTVRPALSFILVFDVYIHF